MKPSEALPKFLRSIGRGTDAQFYLELFRAEAKERFAAIALEDAIVGEAPDAVVLDLRFLSVLGLTPVVVLGLDGPLAPAAVAELKARLGDAQLKTAEFRGARPVGEIIETVRGGVLPLVMVEGEQPAGRLADLGQMLAAMQTRKLIFLQDEGGMRRDGRLVSVVNLSSEYTELIGAPWLSERQQALLQWSYQLIFHRVSHQLVVAVTSPLDLLYELFTVRGAGTLLKRGALISVYRSLKEVDTERLRELLETSFGLPLRQGLFSRSLYRIYLEDNYRGTALVAQTDLGAYLTKFAVTRQAQGEGIGHDLWQQVAQDHQTLFWRARPDNPIVPWYEKQCDGRVKADPWIVYFKGLPVDDVASAIRYAVSQPIDFEHREGG
jgi:hypothetical protein